MQIESAWEPWKASPEQPWSAELASHLFRRAAFGASIEQIETALKDGLDPTLDKLLDTVAASDFEKEVATSGRMLSGSADSKGLSAWWLLRMLQSPCPLLEKMTLFWHGHFATGGEKVLDARAMLNQNKLLRSHALGKFENLVQGISKDPAMLIYLDSTENRKTRPNENYARELLELFCLGPGNYTEHDIKQISRCFTGWEVRSGKFRFNKNQFDSREKKFLERAGDFTGEQAVRIVLDQPAAPRFIARKLIRFFVFDSDPIPDELVKPLALHLRETDFDLTSTMRKLLSSRLFFSEMALGRKIKSPVELAVGTLKFLNATSNMQRITERLERLGQLPFYPPNVKGWDGGTTWINASTVIARANLVAELIDSGNTRLHQSDLNTWFRKNRRKLMADHYQGLNQFLLAGDLTDETKKMLSQVEANSAKTWLTAVTSLPEFQLN